MVFYNESQAAATDQNPFLHKCKNCSLYLMPVLTPTVMISLGKDRGC